MRINEANIFLFIATVIIGILISMNLNLSGKVKFLDLEQYQKAYKERAKLQSQISDLEQQQEELNDKINGYDRFSRDIDEVVAEMEKELRYNEMALGLTPVKGDGIKITLDDSPEFKVGGKYTNSMLIHNSDIVKVINDLRNAGAEAIMINNQRVIYDSYANCGGATIEIDDVKLISPFYITAIGNQEVLDKFIETQENHVKTLIFRMCTVNIELVYDVEIPAYNGKLDINHMKEVAK